MTQESKALAYAFAAVLLWSTVATAFKLALTQLTPAQLLFAACVVSTIFFSGVFLIENFLMGNITGQRVRQSLTGRNVREGALLGLLNPLCYYLLLFEAYARLPAQIAQPLNYTWAITLALLAVPILGQRLTRQALIGVLLSYVGVLVLLSRGTPSLTSNLDGFGISVALASTVIWALYWLRSSQWQTSATSMMLWGFGCATPLVGWYCAITDGLPIWDSHTLTYGLWVGLVEMGVAFLLWQRALQLTAQAAKIGQLIFISPFVSLLFIHQILGEAIHPSAVIGLAIIVAGIVVTRRATQ